MMPDYALGLWQSKMRYQTQDEVMEVARRYKEKGITLSVIVIDFFHWTEQGHFDFDERYWPDPAKMIKELDEMGIKADRKSTRLNSSHSDSSRMPSSA